MVGFVDCLTFLRRNDSFASPLPVLFSSLTLAAILLQVSSQAVDIDLQSQYDIRNGIKPLANGATDAEAMKEDDEEGELLVNEEDQKPKNWQELFQSNKATIDRKLNLKSLAYSNAQFRWRPHSHRHRSHA